jgi:antitoxin ParD1/3/4
MDQMNISITPKLAGYVRTQVKSGRYNNASEVVRDAIRRMQEEEARILRLAEPTAEDVLADLTQSQLDAIRKRVLDGITDIEAGNYTVYEGREGLKQLAGNIKARGRKLLRDAEKR